MIGRAMHATMLRRGVAAVVLLLAARTARAQRALGVVRDSATAAPVAGAVVSLLDAAGHAAARTITDGQGRFAMPLVAASVRVRVVRIGFRPYEAALPSPALAAGDSMTFVMVQIPILLEGVRASDASVCPARTDRAQALTLWEQARSGLLASVVAREANPATMRMLVFQRTLDVHGSPILHQTVHSVNGRSARPFVASRPAAEFAQDGYMEDLGNRRAFDGPDADVMLDESFAATHCFELQRADREHPEQVGLAFVPAPGRDTMVDVAGVLWIDRATPALRTLDFRYTGLEPAAGGVSGGSLTFHSVPSGVVFVERWSIRTAALGEPRAPAVRGRNADMAPQPRRRTQRYDLPLSDLSETGGEIASASWPDGTRWDASLGQVSGHVVAADTRKPVEGVRVWLDGMDDTTTTDHSGAFTFRGLLPGPYAAVAADSALGAYGIAQSAAVPVEARRGQSADVTVELQSHGDALMRSCEDQRLPPFTAMLVVHVLTSDSVAAGDAAFEATWTAYTDTTYGTIVQHESKRRGRTDANGRIQLCGVVRGGDIRIQVEYPGVEPRAHVIHIPPERSMESAIIRLEHAS